MPERVGFEYLAALISQPGRDLDVVWLAAGLSNARERAEAVLDATALREYRQRVGELKTALHERDLSADEERRARDELTALTAALTAAIGHRGRLRAFPDSQERARTSVRKALIRAVAAISAVEPELGRHLTTSIETGAVCRYSPAPNWLLTLRPQAPPAAPMS